jgi:glutamate 5-kinase
MVSGGTSNGHVARGGMKTKIEAVKTARAENIPSIIAGGNVKNVLVNITAGKIIGTYFKS